MTIEKQKYMKKYYRKNKDKRVSYQDDYNSKNTEKHRKYNCEYYNKNRKKILKQRHEYYLKNKEKKFSHHYVKQALASGELKRQPCVICNDSSVEAHHTNYSKPLDVIWLCQTHHRRVHSGTVSLESVFARFKQDIGLVSIEDTKKENKI